MSNEILSEHFKQKALSENQAQQLLKEITDPRLTSAEVASVYDVWADHYEKDLEKVDYNSHSLAALHLSKTLGDSKNLRILDAAAGTGLVGAELKKLGYTTLDALDASQAMLNEAKKKGCYENFICDFLGKNRLDIADDTYDAVVTSGSFVAGHVNDDCFEELIRIIKPGGYFVLIMGAKYLTTVPVFKERLEPRMQLLHNKGAWEWLGKETVPKLTAGYDGLVYRFQIQPGKREYFVENSNSI